MSKKTVKQWPVAPIEDFLIREDWAKLIPDISHNRKQTLREAIKAEGGLLEPLSVLPEKVDGKWVIIDGMQRYKTIKAFGELREIFEKGIPYQVREELTGSTENELKRWILFHAGARRHLNDYQLAVWAHDTAEALGWFDAAIIRQGGIPPMVTTYLYKRSKEWLEIVERKEEENPKNVPKEHRFHLVKISEIKGFYPWKTLNKWDKAGLDRPISVMMDAWKIRNRPEFRDILMLTPADSGYQILYGVNRWKLAKDKRQVNALILEAKNERKLYKKVCDIKDIFAGTYQGGKTMLSYECMVDEEKRDQIIEEGKKVVLEMADLGVDSTTGYEKTRAKIQHTFKVKQTPLRIYSRIRKISVWGSSEEYNKAWKVHDALENGEITYLQATKTLDRLEGKEVKKRPKAFKMYVNDLYKMIDEIYEEFLYNCKDDEYYVLRVQIARPTEKEWNDKKVKKIQGSKARDMALKIRDQKESHLENDRDRLLAEVGELKWKIKKLQKELTSLKDKNTAKEEKS